MTAPGKRSKADDFKPVYFGNINPPTFSPGDMVSHPVHGVGHVVAVDPDGSVSVMYHGKGGAND